MPGAEQSFGGIFNTRRGNESRVSSFPKVESRQKKWTLVFNEDFKSDKTEGSQYNQSTYCPLDWLFSVDWAPEQVKIRSSYNVAGVSFNPQEIAASIQKYIPDFSITYKPDFRQAIADSWPHSINDTEARNHWGWKPKYDLDGMTKDMLENLGGVVR